MKTNPIKYQPLRTLLDPPLPESWSVYSTLATAQFFMRSFGQAGVQELDRLSELQQKGQIQFGQDSPLMTRVLPLQFKQPDPAHQVVGAIQVCEFPLLLLTPSMIEE